ncbi:MAG: FKBP-type peptidyl-prolyl cis-trans isomerase [Salinivirgaceae bacterium]|nr:FKBP-type peptidyl-prolyl cis-trans isomerase [Salinivirgaceae bacterium]
MNRKSINITFAALTIVAILCCSCSSKYEGYSHKNGLYYKLITIGDSISTAKVGNYVTTHLRYSTIADSAFFVGNRTFQLTEPEFNGSIDECFLMMSSGDSSSFIIDAYKFFTITLQSPLPSFLAQGDMMKVDIKMTDIRTEEQYRRDKEEFLKWIEDFGEYEKLVLQNFIERKKIDIEPTPSGLYYIQLTQGTGKAVELGDLVTINYEGRFLNGKFFDSTIKLNQPFEFVYGTEMQVIAGLDEAIGRMREGERALVILPSELAWGDKGSSTGIVPPFTSVIYEIELISAVAPGSETTSEIVESDTID